MSTPVTRNNRHRRTSPGWSRFAILLAVTLATGVGLAGPAAAHNVLIASDPAEGAVLQQPPTVVSLTFDQPVQDFQPVVTVLGADGQRYESGTPVVDSTVVTQTVTTLTVPGPYSIAYRVVSADGHPVQGEVRFELAATASGSAAGAGSSGAGSSGAVASAAATAPPPAPTTSAAATVAPAASTSGISGWVWAAIAVAAALVAIAIVVILRRPRQPDQSP